ncbi:MAG TPA: TraR/DksA family transcriptional regulator [Ktedonobacteraceae bacterium]|nr:TraR/DksA family transcriptional regulator [Ktedonobacteraceae bacterium]
MAINVEAMKKRLQEKQKELQESISRLTEASPKPVDPIEAHDSPEDFEEAAIDSNESEDERLVRANEQSLLQEVQAALLRIQNGTYGKCLRCGKPIPEKRLEALPWAERDVECQEIVERETLDQDPDRYPAN